MNLLYFKKILIIRLSSLGDILLTTPMIRSLKKEYPPIDFDFLIREEYEDVLRFNPHITNLIKLSRNDDLSELKNKLIAQKYDLVIDLQNNLRTKRLVKGISENIVSFKKPNIEKFLLVNFKINLLKDSVPIPVRYAQTIPKFRLDKKGLELFIDENVHVDFKGDDQTIGLCPGSKHYTKMWPASYYVELANQLIVNGFKVLLLGGKDDNEICAEIHEQVPQSINYSNDNDLFKTGALMKECKIIVCNDSGMMHTALAMDVPVISIFGSTVKEFGFAPYKGKSLVLENNSLSCRPCSHIGKAKCPKKHFKCMLTIRPSYVHQQIIQFIKYL